MGRKIAYLFAGLLTLAAAVTGVMIAMPGEPEKITRPDPSEAVEIAFVGDTLLGDYAEKTLKKKGYDAPFVNLRKHLKADYLIGNLEATITTTAKPMSESKAYSYKQNPLVAGVYAKEGFNAFGLANNHSLDFGVEGLKDTVKYLSQAGISQFGAGLNEDEASKPLIIKKNGVTIGVIGCFDVNKSYRDKLNWYAEGDKPGVAPLSRKKLRRQIADLKSQVDVVVVYPHWGGNYRKLRKSQRKYARRLVDAGADLVVGHGAHMPQRVEIIDGKPVVYSVGNFIFGTPGRYKKFKMEKRGYGLIAKIGFSKQGAYSIRLTPFANNNLKVKYIPRVASKTSARRLFKDILRKLGGNFTMDGVSAVIDLTKI